MNDAFTRAMIAALVGTREYPGPFYGDEDAARFWAPEMVRVYRRVTGTYTSPTSPRPVMTNAIAGPATTTLRGVR